MDARAPVKAKGVGGGRALGKEQEEKEGVTKSVQVSHSVVSDPL